MVLGSAHQAHGAIGLGSVGRSLAVATSAGAVAKPEAPHEPNEDAGAVVGGVSADLLVVADAHHGSLASRIAVEAVADAVGSNPSPADLSDPALEAIVYEIGLAIHDETTPDSGTSPRPSRTTLAFALVTAGSLRWASFGDSIVLAGDATGVAELGCRRSAYLGQGFLRAEVATFLDRGQRTRSQSEYVILATDGLLSLTEARPDHLRGILGRGDGAAGVAREIVAAALAAGADDSVTVAVASPLRSL